MARSVENRTVEILANQAMLEPQDVDMTHTLQDLGIDSLGLVECIFAIEEEFDIHVPFNANEPEKSEFDISTVASMVAAVKVLVAQQGK